MTETTDTRLVVRCQGQVVLTVNAGGDYSPWVASAAHKTAAQASPEGRPPVTPWTRWALSDAGRLWWEGLGFVSPDAHERAVAIGCPRHGEHQVSGSRILEQISNQPGRPRHADVTAII